MKKGIIGIEDLAISCIIGCTEKERYVTQTILIDCRIECDFSRMHDAIEHTVDYRQVAALAEAISKRKFFLIETFAQHFAEAVVAQFSQVQSCFVCVRKPHILENVESCFVEYTAFNT